MGPRMGGPSSDFGFGVSSAADGSVYTTGWFRGRLISTLALTRNSSMPLVAPTFSCRSSIRRELRVGSQHRGTRSDYGRAISVGADGGIYLAGSFRVRPTSTQALTRTPS